MEDKQITPKDLAITLYSIVRDECKDDKTCISRYSELIDALRYFPNAIERLYDNKLSPIDLFVKANAIITNLSKTNGWKELEQEYKKLVENESSGTSEKT